MSDPVSISTTLQNLKLQIQAMAFYQQMTGDQTAAAWITTSEATLASNEGTTPPQGYKSVLADSVFRG